MVWLYKIKKMDIEFIKYEDYLFIEGFIKSCLYPHNHRDINITNSIPLSKGISTRKEYMPLSHKIGERDFVKMDEKVLPIIHMLYDRYNRYHNVIVTNERIRKVMGTTRKGRANKKVLEYLHKLEILEPYYDNEPIDTTKVWKVNIEKVEGYLESAG